METVPERINLDAVTIQDCLDNYTYKNKAAILNDGKILGFEEKTLPINNRQGG